MIDFFNKLVPLCAVRRHFYLQYVHNICAFYLLSNTIDIVTLWQLEQQQSEKVAEAEKTDTVETSVVELMKSKASFLLKFAGCVSVQSKVEVIIGLVTVQYSTK